MTIGKTRTVFLSAALLGTLVLPSSAVAASCSDAWVTQLTTKYLGHPPSSPNAPQCNIYLYRNGHWNSYAELDAAVAARYSVNPDPDPAGRATAPGNIRANAGSTGASVASVMRMPASSFGGRAVIGSQYVINGNTYQLISNDGSSVTLKIVAQGGGNIVAQGGGNRPQQGIVSTGGNNLRRY